MAGNAKERWIVLLNKSPKGPLVAEEIRELLDKGILRPNDIAYQLPDNTDSKSPTQWKLLWQFPEFDRRREPVVAPAAEITSPADDRRKQEPTLEKKLAQIPPELLNIAPEDLIPRSSNLTASFDRDRDEAEAPTVILELPDRDSIREGVSGKWVFASVALVLVGAGLWMFTHSGTIKSVITETRPPSPVAPSKPTPPSRSVVDRKTPAPTANAAPTRRTPAEAPRPVEPDSSEPDRGEVLEDEDVADDSEDRSDSPVRTARDVDPRFDPRNIDPRMPGGDPRMMDPRMRMLDPRSGAPRMRDLRTPARRLTDEAETPEDSGAEPVTPEGEPEDSQD